jgi:hypothetical protein
MTRLKTIRPSPSYALALPDVVREERYGRVSSFWGDGKPLLFNHRATSASMESSLRAPTLAKMFVGSAADRERPAMVPGVAMSGDDVSGIW